MTVAHAFGGSNEHDFPKLNNATNFEFDLVGMSGSGEGDDISVDKTSRGSISSEGDNSDTNKTSNRDTLLQPWDQKASQLSVSHRYPQKCRLPRPCRLRQRGKDIMSQGQYQQRQSMSQLSSFHRQFMQPLSGIDISESTFTSSEGGPFPSLDYALIEVTYSERAMTDRIVVTGKGIYRAMVLKQVSRGAPAEREVVVVVRAPKGTIKGHMSGTPSFMQLPHATSQQELSTVIMEENFERGDCGS